MATTSASPSPISAADSTMTNTVKNWPVISMGVTNRENASRFRSTAIDISSSDMSTWTAPFFDTAP